MAFLFDKLQQFFLLTSTRITFDFIKFKIKASCKGDSKKVHVLLEFKANTDDKNNIKKTAMSCGNSIN